jgi:2-polyprenyl-3-methyl-5-hydroxy-6-metoxy-1,4-benzoquinol methylase
MVMLDIEKLRKKVARLTKRSWMKHALRNISNNDNHVGLERAYRVNDPWNLDSPVEHTRFAATNRALESCFGRVSSMLEVGCGEGLQSSYLQRLTDNLHGIDVSPTAVARARQRVPDAQFHVGDLCQLGWHEQGRRFDVVVACEVLYYVRDVPATLAAMNSLGDHCFVSFYSPEAHKLSDFIREMPNVQQGWATDSGFTWLMAWWSNRQPAVSCGPGAK